MSEDQQREQYLLDQYAGQAMRGLLASGMDMTMRDTRIVQKSWDYAELMVKERQERMKKARRKPTSLSGEQK